MDLGIASKVAVVTASTRGLGRGCAEALAAEGCRLVICSRDSDSAEAAAEEISRQFGVDVLGVAADMARKEDIDHLVQRVRSAFGDPEIVVANAGGPPPGTFQSTPLSEYPKALELNLMSAVHLIHQCCPAMKANNWGRIIAITSISVKQPIGNLLLSNMARSGLTGFLKTISTELAPHGITVNALLPGTHQTSRITQLIQDTAAREGEPEETILQKMLAAIPCNAIGDPKDFGAACAFLASEQARYITGQNLLVDGGRYGGLL